MTIDRTLAAAAMLGLAASLAGCKKDIPPPPEPTSSPEAKSIFRPEFQAEPTESPETLKPLEEHVVFPEGTVLSDEANAILQKVLASPQVAAGGDIVLRGHSDSGGSDAANLRSSLKRAEAVRDYLVENGIDEGRIKVIAFGEQNPVAPNALPDGTPNEAGRARNRRVDIEVAVAEAPPEPQEPTLAETLAEESTGATPQATPSATPSP